MVPLSRARRQELNRAKVLAAAREEFSERGFRDAGIDRIARRADLTRGAVYSNFPGKRALYFAALAEAAEQVPSGRAGATTETEALGAYARAWVTRLPIGGTDERAGAEFMSQITADPRLGKVFAQLVAVESVILGASLERLGPGGRRVRLARSVLTTLHGAGRLAAAAPGFTDPFTVIRACEHLAELDFEDERPLPHLAHVPDARPVDEPWEPWTVPDLLTRRRAKVAEGVLVVLGLHRLEALEDALSAVPEGTPVTLVPVTSESGELLPLVRLSLAEIRVRLSRSVPASARPALRITLDQDLAAFAGVVAPDDETEEALLLRGGRVAARASGRGAGHAVAVFRDGLVPAGR